MKPRAGTWSKGVVLVSGVVFITLLHRLAPTDSHAWHPWHLVAERLYYVPILLGAAWLPVRGSVVVTFAACLGYFAHVMLDWRGQPMLQAEQGANLATFWILSLTASLLFGRLKGALQRVEAAREETLTGLAASLELREPYTSGHSRRVRDYTLKLAERLGIRDGEALRLIGAGALFHDVGKIGVPDSILLKAGPLSPEEEKMMRRHPEMGADLVGRVGSLKDAAELVLSHHERYDGTGYPRGLRGELIPRAARIFAVADAFDAMTTDRLYRRALSFDEAARRLSEGRGRQFDPEVVDALLALGSDQLKEVSAAGAHSER
jgi:HD-GYP domain-containing protein (c-di-GMP phosphodiesterase class II)